MILLFNTFDEKYNFTTALVFHDKTHLKLAINTRNIDEDVLVVAGDMLFDENALDITQVVRYFNSVKTNHQGNLSIYYEMEQYEDPSTRGIIELDKANRITQLFEKPESDEITKSRFASVVFYCLRQEVLPKVKGFHLYYIESCISISKTIS